MSESEKPVKCVCGSTPRVTYPHDKYGHNVATQLRCPKLGCGIRGPEERHSYADENYVVAWNKMLRVLTHHDALVDALMLENEHCTILKTIGAV